jgi:hypothetical protein
MTQIKMISFKEAELKHYIDFAKKTGRTFSGLVCIALNKYIDNVENQTKIELKGD